MKENIRPIVTEDIPHLQEVLNSIDLFPSEMLPELIQDYLENPDCEDIWFTALDQEAPVAIGYCTPEKLTDGTYNLLAIGVKRKHQRKGLGKGMMKYIENELDNQGHRILIVETSGTPEFSKVRSFYESLGYQREAVIRDFWKEGDDKVIFWKKIRSIGNT